MKNTFKKSERLCRNKWIDLLFAKGKTIRISKLRVTFILHNEIVEQPVQIMFSVPKRIYKKAVDRNLLKRRMREAYRTNKNGLLSFCNENNKQLFIAVNYSNNEIISYQEIEKEIRLILDKLQIVLTK